MIVVEIMFRKIKSTTGILKNKVFYKRHDYTDVSMLKLRVYDGYYHNKRCFLIGSGPSLRDENLEPLKKEITMGMNLSYKYFPATFHTVASQNILMRYGYDVLGLKKLFLSGTASRYYLRNKDIFNLDNQIITIPDYGEIQTWENIHRDIARKGVRGGFSVSLIALQILGYMGFSEIFLLGHDCNYTDDTLPFYRYELSGKLREKARNRNKHWSTVFANYKIIKDNFEEKGIKIYNASSKTNLDVFEKVKLEDVLLWKR